MARSADHEPRLRIHIGPSSYDQRAFTVWTRLSEGRRPKKYRRSRDQFGEDILLPLKERQVIIADSAISRQPQAMEGEIFVITRGPRGWMVNETLIAEGREYMPAPIASRTLRFDVVRTRTVAA